MQRMASGDQDLFRRAAPVRTSPTKITIFNNGNRHPCRSRRTRHGYSGISAAENDDIEFVGVRVSPS
jgi:hypothetical protein